MAKERSINTRFWSDNWITDLNPLDRYLFLYLLTNEHTEICGIYELPWRVMSNETGIEIEMLKKMFKRLAGKAHYVDGWVYIKNYQKHHVYTKDGQKGVERGLLSVPDRIKEKIELIEGATPVPPPIHPPAADVLNPNPNPNPNPILNPCIPKGIEATPPAVYGNPEINEVIDFFKGELRGSLDGPVAVNRRFAKLLLDRFRKDYPDISSVDNIKKLISVALKDKFHSRNATSFKYLYYNAQKIIQANKGGGAVAI